MITQFLSSLAQSRSRVSMAACAALILGSSAGAQEPTAGSTAGPTLVPGSKVDLSAVLAAEWLQGAGPTSFEPDHIYVFECWATWCPPCVALIPHLNELHEKYYAKGLRVHGMNVWEEERDAAVNYVKARGAGMSYPVAFAHGSAFESKWLKAAGVEAIPHAFVVRNGKLLLATEGARLTEELVEAMLSGDEGAERAAAQIKAAYEAREKTDKLVQQIKAAGRKKDPETMVASLNELEATDPAHPELPTLKLRLLMAAKQWDAAVSTLNAMPSSYSKGAFLFNYARSIAQASPGEYPLAVVKAVTLPYAEQIDERGDAIGPNHFAYLSILHWMIGDKETALRYTEKGVEVAMSFSRASEIRTNAFKRFAKSAREGVMPKFSDLVVWQVAARKKAEAQKEATFPEEHGEGGR